MWPRIFSPGNTIVIWRVDELIPRSAATEYLSYQVSNSLEWAEKTLSN